MRLIVTRPEPDATRTARALIRLGHEAILSPMLDIVLDSERQHPVASVSGGAGDEQQRGPRAWQRLRSTPVSVEVPLYAVGDQTRPRSEARRLCGRALSRRCAR